MLAGQLTEDRVVQLRSQDRSYGAIARVLGLRDGYDACEVFRRALRRHPPAEQARLREEELDRLDILSEALLVLPYLSEHGRASSLQALARLRQMVLAS